MAKVERIRSDECEIIKQEINGRLTFKCRNLKRTPTIQEVIDSVNTKIILK